MKDTLTDANFPRTADLRVYHLALRTGEVANRIITVGAPSRANAIAKYLDASPKPFVLTSERGFMTITGRYKQIPISIVSIGMGSPNLDFFVREVRECLSGDMVVVRLGSCGALIDIPVGSVVVPRACIAISRNVDFDFVNPESSTEPSYHISKQVSADMNLHDAIYEALEATKPKDSSVPILPGVVNASADSFYSSQGRQTLFPDHNEHLLAELRSSTEDLTTLEMETFHLYHLAHCWGGRATSRKSTPPPPTTTPVSPSISQSHPTTQEVPAAKASSSNSVIRAAAAQMVFASRTSQDFISPQQVAETEDWTGKAVLEALAGFEILIERLHDERGSVWELTK
ncbi:nucleoside phosphorylase domain-containing protein [Cyathus striatus]|nr:nucleoside phosphorylase domain-containing protein [Cyathus striatus]